MKKKQTLISLFLIFTLLFSFSSCNSNENTNEASSKTKKSSSVEDVLNEQTKKEAASNKDKNTKDSNQTSKDNNLSKNQNTKDSSQDKSSNKNIDIDLSDLNANLAYAQLSGILEEPDKYVGKTIKMKGTFSYIKDDKTKKSYYSCMVADSTACCNIGLEFVWKGKHSYPDDYPKIDSEITVCGTFNTYTEGSNVFAELKDATLSF